MKCKPLEPYLFGAWYHWMCDSNLTPHIIVLDDQSSNLVVPKNYIKDDHTITLNISPQATESFDFDDLAVKFSARFDHGTESIHAPFKNIIGIFAKENGQGTFFIPQNESKQDLTDQSKKTSSKTRPPHLKLI